VYAVDLKGRTLATIRVVGATNVDWEDVARGKDENGEPVLFLGDIGDNDVARKSIIVYRMPEPVVDPERTQVAMDSGPVVRYELEYEDGPQNAETLMVDPRGRLYIVSKSPLGSKVYAAPASLRTDRVNTMKKIGAINFLTLPATTARLRDQAARLLATGGAISEDGRYAIVRSYTDAYEWTIPNGDVTAAFKGAPRQVKLPSMEQGEAITYRSDGKSILTGTEGVRSPVYEVGVTH